MIVCKLISSVFPAAIAWIGRGLINAVVEASKDSGAGLSTIWYWIILSLAVVLLREVIGAGLKFMQRRLNDALHLKIDLDILRHASELDVSWFEDPHFQDVIDRARQNTSAHCSSFLNKMLALGTNILKIVGLVSILIVIDPIIVAVTIPIVLPFMLFKWHQSQARFNKEYSRATKRRWKRYFGSLLTGRQSVAEIKLLKLAPFLIDRYRTLAIEFVTENQRIFTRALIGNFVFSVIFAVTFYLLFGRIAARVLGGDLTVGDVAMFAGAAGALRGLLTSLADQVSGAAEDALFINNLKTFFKIKPRIETASGKSIDGGRGEIAVENVSFAYPGSEQTVLTGISLHIHAGETVALVGENGAGKTTLVKLIARLYEPTEGCIRFDGADVRELSIADLHRQISFVFQRVNRYEATAAENIAYGNWWKTQSREQVKTMARLADMHGMIESMPEGYDTMLGRKFGVFDLSGGQWRRIAIARALTRTDASLLILDEPTSGLDARAEYALFCRFCEIAAGRTTILVSHRFSTVKLANRIIVMDKGRIIEYGAHQELLDQGGHYASLYSLHQHQMIYSAPNKN